MKFSAPTLIAGTGRRNDGNRGGRLRPRPTVNFCSSSVPAQFCFSESSSSAFARIVCFISRPFRPERPGLGNICAPASLCLFALETTPTRVNKHFNDLHSVKRCESDGTKFHRQASPTAAAHIYIAYTMALFIVLFMCFFSLASLIVIFSLGFAAKAPRFTHGFARQSYGLSFSCTEKKKLLRLFSLIDLYRKKCF